MSEFEALPSSQDSVGGNFNRPLATGGHGLVKAGAVELPTGDSVGVSAAAMCAAPKSTTGKSAPHQSAIPVSVILKLVVPRAPAFSF